MSHPESARGQMNSLDLAVAILIFAVLLMFYVGFWYTAANGGDNGATKNRLEYYAAGATDMLVKSQGYPTNWELSPASIQMAGLAYSPNLLSEQKVSNFTALNYTREKQLLGVGEADFYFWVEDLNGTRLYQSGNATARAEIIVGVTRHAYMRTPTGGSKPVRVRMVLYAN